MPKRAKYLFIKIILAFRRIILHNGHRLLPERMAPSWPDGGEGSSVSLPRILIPSRFTLLFLLSTSTPIQCPKTLTQSLRNFSWKNLSEQVSSPWRPERKAISMLTAGSPASTPGAPGSSGKRAGPLPANTCPNPAYPLQPLGG